MARTQAEKTRLEEEAARLRSELAPFLQREFPLPEGDQQTFNTLSGQLLQVEAALQRLEGKAELDEVFLSRPAPGADAAGMIEPRVEMRLSPEELDREKAALREEEEARRRDRREYSMRWLTDFEEPFILQVWLTPEPGKVEPERFLKRTEDYDRVAYIRARTMEGAWHLCQNTPGPWNERFPTPPPGSDKAPHLYPGVRGARLLDPATYPGNYVIEAYAGEEGLRNLQSGDVLVNLRTGRLHMIDESLEKRTFIPLK